MSSSTRLDKLASRLQARPALQVRLYKAASLILVLLSLAACGTAPASSACFWPQSWASGCQEMMEAPGR